MKKKLFSLLAVMLMSLTANAQHEYVDLGLPSGTLWATCNIGADSPEEEGDKFAWGETTTKDYFTKENYSFYGNPEVLDAEDDAAAVNWGSEWRMPTNEQCEELECGEYTTNEVTTLNGVKVVRVTGKNGNSIFLPEESYWTTHIGTVDDEPDTSRGDAMAVSPNVFSLLLSLDVLDRYYGCCIRPVRVSGAQGTQYTISNIPDSWKVNGTKVTNGTYKAEEGAKVIFTPANIPAGKKIKSIKAVKQ